MIEYIFQETPDVSRPIVNIYYYGKTQTPIRLEIDPLDQYFSELSLISFMQEAEEIIKRWETVFEWLLDPKFKFSSAQMAIDASYPFGGWSPFEGFSFKNGALSYPGDPDMHPLWKLVRYVPTTEEEGPYTQIIYGYPHDWIVVVNEDGSFQVSRLD